MKNDYIRAPASRGSRYLIKDFSYGADTVTDEGVLNFNYAAECYNFISDSGVLKDGWGLKIPFFAASLTGVKSAWQYRRFRESAEVVTQMYLDRLGAVHELENGEDKTLSGVTFTSKVMAAAYRLYGKDVVLLCSETDGMAVYDGTVLYKVDAAPLITSLTTHYERLFVTTSGERNTVRFSDDLDPTNWAEDLNSGGFIQLIDAYGKSNKIISFLNYLYVLRDYGITRMTAYANQTDFTVSNLFVSCGKIYADTAAVCGDKILFLSGEGLYAFDGMNTSRVLKRLGRITLHGEKAVARYREGKYFLAYPSGEGANDSLLVYDINNNKFSLSKGISIESFYGGEELYAVSEGRLVELDTLGAKLGVPLQKRWRIPLSDLGSPDKRKRLKEIYIETNKPLKLTVLCDHKSSVFDVKGQAGVPVKVNVGVTGRKIGLIIESGQSGVRIGRCALMIMNIS